MKKLLRLKTFALLAMFGFLLFTVTSCIVFPKTGKSRKGNNGKHKGWHKGKGNKHSQNSAIPWVYIENSKE
ncbi:MAG: hypothetical protein JXR51_06920 [Bacteroidales bacterium]|nr:hypothetical protein [Bacteroidales bacterium]